MIDRDDIRILNWWCGRFLLCPEFLPDHKFLQPHGFVKVAHALSPKIMRLHLARHSKDKLYTWTGDSLRFSEIYYWQNHQKMTLISFVDLRKKICFPKFEDCSPKIKSATVILSLIFSRAWQSYFLCHTHGFLKNCVIFIGEQMILVSFFFISLLKIQ